MSVLAKQREMDEFAEAIGIPVEEWVQQCHAISIALVKAKVWRKARVARGACQGVGGQHSWVVVGDDCYDEDAEIVDPTLWSYDKSVKGVWSGTLQDGRHFPHGYDPQKMTIWEWGRPPNATDVPIKLTPKFELSGAAKTFLKALGPLDYRGWMVLANNAPLLGWPAGEIFAAMDDTEKLKVVVPIDLLGMLTDRNPSGLYLP